VLGASQYNWKSWFDLIVLAHHTSLSAAGAKAPSQ
jgi:hypothetical protein